MQVFLSLPPSLVAVKSSHSGKPLFPTSKVESAKLVILSSALIYARIRKKKSSTSSNGNEDCGRSMLINARGGVQKCESCLHTSLKFERGRRKFPLKPPRSKQAKERVERRRKDRGSNRNPSRMIYLITRVAGMIVCRYSVLGKEKGVQEFLPKCLNTIPLLQTCHHIMTSWPPSASHMPHVPFIIVRPSPQPQWPM